MGGVDVAGTGELLSYYSGLSWCPIEQSLGSGRGAGGLEWNWGEKRLARGEKRQELGEQQGSEGTGIGAGLKVILCILARFDYVI